MTKEFKELMLVNKKGLEELQKVLDDFGIYNTMNLIDTLKNIKFLEKQNTINSNKLKAFETIKEHFVKIGGIRGNCEGKKPKNEIVITLKDLTAEEFDFLEEKLR